MKKTIISLIALFCMSVSVSAQKVTIPDVYATPGQTITGVLNFELPEDTYSGFQAVLEFPEGLTFTIEQEGAFTGLGSGLYDKQGQLLKFNCANPFNVSSIEVTYAITIDETVDYNDYEVAYRGTIEGYEQEDVPFSGTFKVHINNFIVLDENSTIAPKKTDSKERIKLKRTFKKDEWSTLCLPFAVNSTVLNAAFGEGNYEIAQLSGYEVVKEGDDVTGLDVQFKKVAGAKANTPIIIKVNKDVDKMTEVFEAQVAPGATKLFYTETDEETFEDVEIWSMTGTYVTETVVPANSLFLNSNLFYYSTGLTKMKAFRAYFTFKDVLSSLSSAGSRMKFFVTDGDETTEIKIPELLNDGEYYNLNGVRVETPSKGIYIKDGKKVVVK